MKPREQLLDEKIFAASKTIRGCRIAAVDLVFDTIYPLVIEEVIQLAAQRLYEVFGDDPQQIVTLSLLDIERIMTSLQGANGYSPSKMRKILK